MPRPQSSITTATISYPRSFKVSYAEIVPEIPPNLPSPMRITGKRKGLQIMKEAKSIWKHCDDSGRIRNSKIFPPPQPQAE